MFTDLINMLKHSLIQSHYYHTTTQSYSEHKALDNYYDTISSHIDALIESYQGTYDILIKDYNILPLILDDNVLGYFKTLRDTIKINKYKYISEDDSHLLNILDECFTLITTTIYKLTFLK